MKICATNVHNRPFATNDHMVQNPPCWRAGSLLLIIILIIFSRKALSPVGNLQRGSVLNNFK